MAERGLHPKGVNIEVVL